MQPSRFSSTIPAIRTCASLLACGLLVAGCSEEGKRARSLKRADDYFAAGNYDAAQIEYKNVLRADPKNNHAIARMGAIWMEEGAPLRAAPFLVHIRDVSPDDLESRMKLALALRSLGEGTAAREEATAVLAKEPGNEQAILLLGETARDAEQLEALRKHLGELAAGDDPPIGYYLGSAFLSIRSSDFASAMEMLQKALAKDPKSIRAHMAMANIHQIQGDREEAEATLKKAAEISPLRSNARMRLADLYLRQRRFEDARGILAAMKKEAPGFLPASNYLARVALAEEKFEDAIRQADDVLARDETNFDARLLKSQAILGQNDAAKAATILERLDADFPNLPFTKFHLARAYATAGKTTLALAKLDDAVTLNPGFEEAVIFRATLQLRSGDANAAISAMTALLEKNPRSGRAQALLANAYAAAGQFENALRIFRAQAAAAPDQADPQFMIGRILRAQGKGELAREAFLKAAELAPDDLNVAARLVELDLTSDNVDAAKSRVKKLLENSPDVAPAHFLKATIHATQREWEETESSLKASLELDASYSRAYELLISVYLESDRLDEARQELEGAVASNPENIPTLLLAATVQQKLQDFSAARATYEKILKINPNVVLAQNNLAIIYTDHFDKTKEAYELATRARAANPNDPAIADTLGWVSFHRGEFAKAATLIEESAVGLSDQAEILYHLGRARYMMGRPADAKSAFERALASTGEFTGRKQAEAHLRRIAQLQSEPPPTIEALTKLAAGHPDDPVVQLALAQAHADAGRPGEAKTACEAALGINPDLLAAHTLLARLYGGPLNDSAKALDHARRARALAPGDSAIAASLGGIALDFGNAEWAYSLLRESDRQDSGNPSVLFNLAAASYRTGRLAEAKDALQRARSSNPEETLDREAAAFLEVLALQRDVSDPDAARVRIETALAIESIRLPARMAQAAAQAASDDDNAAMSTYRAVLKDTPGFALAQLELARLLARSNQDDDLNTAEQLIKEARKDLSADPRVTTTLAEIGFRTKRFPYAIRLMKELQTAGPLDAEGLAILGLCQVQTDDQAAGKVHLQQALDAGLRGPLLGPVREALAQ